VVGRAASRDRTAASGIYLASYFAGGLVGSAVLGQAFDRLGWDACVIGIALALVAAAVLTVRLRVDAGVGQIRLLQSWLVGNGAIANVRTAQRRDCAPLLPYGATSSETCSCRMTPSSLGGRHRGGLALLEHRQGSGVEATAWPHRL